MNYSKFSFTLTPTDPTAKLGFETWINDQCVFRTDHVHEMTTVTGYLPADDVETDHVMKLVLTGKTAEHTRVNEAGEIVQDALLNIDEIEFDSIKLGCLVHDLFQYHHDFNGTGSATTDQFFGTLGCNGTVELKFSTPIYLWFLENM